MRMSMCRDENNCDLEYLNQILNLHVLLSFPVLVTNILAFIMDLVWQLSAFIAVTPLGVLTAFGIPICKHFRVSLCPCKV